MKTQLMKQPTLFGQIESPNIASDYLMFAEEKVKEWQSEPSCPIASQEDFNKAVIAAANAFTPLFDEECMRLKMTPLQVENARKFIMRVMGNPRQISQETFARTWRKLRESEKWPTTENTLRQKSGTSSGKAY
jgi:hypothetical protein